MEIDVRVVNRSGHPLPTYETAGAAGVDLRACLAESCVVAPLCRALILTGLTVAIPDGYEGQIRSRSGLSLKRGLVVLNSPGTIDSDYRGEIGIIVANLSTESITIADGDRIAQLVIAPVARARFTAVEQLEATDRGEGGFGSTGTR